MSILWSLEQLSPSTLLAKVRRHSRAEIELVFAAFLSAQEQVQDIRLRRLEAGLADLVEQRQAEEDSLLAVFLVEIAFSAVTMAFPPLIGLRAFLLLRHLAAGRFLLRGINTVRGLEFLSGSTVRRAIIRGLFKGAQAVAGRQLKEAAATSLDDLLEGQWKSPVATGSSPLPSQGQKTEKNMSAYNTSLDSAYFEFQPQEMRQDNLTVAVSSNKALQLELARNLECLEASASDSVGVRLAKEQRVELQSQIQAQDMTLDLAQELIDLCERRVFASEGNELLKDSASGKFALVLLEQMEDWWLTESNGPLSFDGPEPENLTWAGLLETIHDSLLEVALVIWSEQDSTSEGPGPEGEDSEGRDPANTFELLALFFEASIWLKLYGQGSPEAILGEEGPARTDLLLARYFDCRFTLLKKEMFHNEAMETRVLFAALRKELG